MVPIGQAEELQPGDIGTSYNGCMRTVLWCQAHGQCTLLNEAGALFTIKQAKRSRRWRRPL